MLPDIFAIANRTQADGLGTTDQNLKAEIQQKTAPASLVTRVQMKENAPFSGAKDIERCLHASASEAEKNHEGFFYNPKITMCATMRDLFLPEAIPVSLT